MAKHDRTKKEKQARNALYALRYQQRRCEDCAHRSCRKGRCRMCEGRMK